MPANRVRAESVRGIVCAGGNFMKQPEIKWLRWAGRCATLVLFLTVMTSPAAAQKKKDKKKDAPAEATSAILSALPDTQVVDQTIGQALGYWQIGDVNSMHQYYSDDVVVVSGAWEPPVIGWEAYSRAYQAQRARVMTGRMDRLNTYSKVYGNSAWATYQWVYTATSPDGKLSEFHGHTTLVLNKVGERWVIVLDHSSLAPEAAPVGPAPSGNVAAPAQPSRP